MKLSEIQRIDQKELNDDLIKRGIERALSAKNRRNFSHLGDVEVLWGDGASSHEKLFTFLKSRTPLGYAVLHKAKLGGVDGYIISEIGLREKLRGMGIGLAFYKLLLEDEFVLFSGHTQTPDGEKTWKKLLASNKIHTYVFDDQKDRWIKADDPWSSPNYVLVASKNSIREAEEI
jgi:hypothetical protein